MIKLGNNKGITLIALVITIIVLLILAGVVLNSIMGQENTIEKAVEAGKKNDEGAELDKIKLAIVDAIARGNDVKVWDENLRIALSGIIDDTEIEKISGDGPWTITSKLGKKYEIDGYGKIEEIASPTDIYVSLDGNVLRFYNQKENCLGALYSDLNGPINFKDTEFSSESMVQWYKYNRDNITTAVIEDEIIPQYTKYWFYGCRKLTNIVNIENLKTDIVTDMQYMFCGCSALQELDLTQLRIENVTNMSNMFCGCSALKELDVTNFNTKNLTNTAAMFKNCSSLVTIYGNEKFDTTAVTEDLYMFYGCNNLVGGRGSFCRHENWYANTYSGKQWAHIDGIGGRGLFTSINKFKEEYIILGDALEGVNGETNEDDWKIISEDVSTGKKYAMLDSYLPVVDLPEGFPFVTKGTYEIYASNTGDNSVTGDQFFSILSNSDFWSKLISKDYADRYGLKVYGGLPIGNEESEDTMKYINKRRDGLYFIPKTAGYLGMGYKLAERAYPTQDTSCWSAQYHNGGGYSMDPIRYAWTSDNSGLCPIVIIPSDVPMFKNDKGIWILGEN